MEVVVRSRDDRTLVFEVKGEGHTLCNALREALLMDRSVVFAAYRIDHPLISNPVFTVRTDGSKRPEEALVEAADRIIAFTREFEGAVRRAFNVEGLRH
ncbi:DNA-directed RNA polymerase subunit L [Candidatus Geothermarchaeota archaeon ex4572_27]|nr:MAG: DNA-directed RNA polymerase subunit L [Candidatus Geothermarchaeota archaeon ex4572_27]